MTNIGWTGEGPDRAPAMPLTKALLANGRGESQSQLERAQARARADEAREALEAEANAPDLDERAANLIARGVNAGLISDLSARLGDAQNELADELDKIERGERRAAQVRRMHEQGQVGAIEASKMLDGDFGEATRAAKLKKRVENLEGQLRDASALATTREPDPLEAAASRAHSAFVEETRARMAAAEQGRPVVRPFGSRDLARSFADGTASGSDCDECAGLGATWEESFKIHHDDSLKREFEAETGLSLRSAAAQAGEITRTYDASGRVLAQ